MEKRKRQKEEGGGSEGREGGVADERSTHQHITEEHTLLAHTRANIIFDESE